MALPPTGSAITMSEIYNYFSATGAYSLGDLGTYMGISSGTVVAVLAYGYDGNNNVTTLERTT